MECPSCESTEIRAMPSLQYMVFGSTTYRMECIKCGYKWKKHRPKRGKGYDLRNWDNVQIQSNWLEQIGD